MPETTLCWACSHEYAIGLDACPRCGATNGNADFERAMEELRERGEEARRRLIVQTRCPMCHGIGYRTALVTISGEEQAARCCWCGGTGYYWVEVDHAA
jgi:hypothetical protein